MNITWKILHSRYSVLFQFEWSVFQLTLCGRYCTIGRQLSCRFYGVFFSEDCVGGTAQEVNSGIVTLMVHVTVKNMWKLLHSR